MPRMTSEPEDARQADQPRPPRATLLWGGRFSAKPDALMQAINVSIGFDRRLAGEDLAGSRAHAAMLARGRHHLARRTRRRSSAASPTIEAEIAAGTFPFRDEFEDIHMNVEKRLDGADRRRRPGGCTPPARATTRWRSTSASGCAPPATAPSSRSSACSARCSPRPRPTPATLMPGFTHLQTRPAGDLRPPPDGLCRDVRPRRRPLRRRPGADERVPAGRGGAGRHLVPDRPRR